MILLVAACHAGSPTSGGTMAVDASAVQAQVMKTRKAGEVTVKAVASPAVPGLALYQVVIPGEEAAYSGAVVRGSEILLDGDAERAAIAAAWGYGAVRSQPAATVAEAMLITVETLGRPTLIATEDAAAYARKLGVEGVTPPAETTVDGLPALNFWFRTGQNPAQELILVFGAAGPELRWGRAHSGG